MSVRTEAGESSYSRAYLALSKAVGVEGPLPKAALSSLWTPDATEILHDFTNSPGDDSRPTHQPSNYNSSFSCSLSVESMARECDNLVPLVVIIHIASSTQAF